ncbi:hypothetical protein [Xylanibacter oryzae]|uniref:hypothetical protein n=1 Tax=Xylanibacter oryzae TaxID=185293 RepID=UPI0012B63744|nr:hypothetical protein [Xylanibacter oryzae]
MLNTHGLLASPTHGFGRTPGFAEALPSMAQDFPEHSFAIPDWNAIYNGSVSKTPVLPTL